MIIGSCGAGKSTLSRRLSAITGIEIIHLDKEHWQPGWTEPSTEEWRRRVAELVQRDRWIMDGNYGGTMDLRLPHADTIIFLDRPTWLCLYRVGKRVLSTYGRVRPDMAEGCPERFDWEFIQYVYSFRRKHRPRILAHLQHLRDDQELIVLRKESEVKALLKKL